jgi:polyisoprenoid-binding protein YceI
MQIIITVLALTATALAAPTAESQCLKAAKDLTFQIRDFTFQSRAIYSTPAHLATSEGTVEFDFAVSAKKVPIRCSATSAGTYPGYFQGNTWYACDATDTFSASFKYDLETGLVNLKAHWNCPE